MTRTPWHSIKEERSRIIFSAITLTMVLCLITLGVQVALKHALGVSPKTLLQLSVQSTWYAWAVLWPAISYFRGWRKDIKPLTAVQLKALTDLAMLYPSIRHELTAVNQRHERILAMHLGWAQEMADNFNREKESARQISLTQEASQKLRELLDEKSEEK